MAHPALFRDEVRFCDDAATPSSDIPTMIVYDTWEKPPLQNAGLKASSKERDGLDKDPPAAYLNRSLAIYGSPTQRLKIRNRTSNLSVEYVEKPTDNKASRRFATATDASFCL